MKFSSLLLCCCTFLFWQCQTESDTKTSAAAALEQPVTPTQETSSVELKPLPSWPATPSKEKGKILPYDEASRDASLLAFRAKLYKAVQKKDLPALLILIDDNIRTGFDGSGGKTDFINLWRLDSLPENSEVWQQLSDCLVLGGGFGPNDSNNFYAPYLFVSDIITDAFEEAAIIGENVRLREGPNSKSEIVGSLTWDVVSPKIDGVLKKETINGVAYPWYKVVAHNGETGYVYGKFLRYSIDYRIGMHKGKDGTWKVDLFVAGD